MQFSQVFHRSQKYAPREGISQRVAVTLRRYAWNVTGLVVDDLIWLDARARHSPLFVFWSRSGAPEVAITTTLSAFDAPLNTSTQSFE